MSKDKKQIAFELYRDSNGEMLLKDIAERVGASPGTVRTWKSRNKWDELIGVAKVETQRNVTRNATDEKEVPRALIELNDNSDLTEQQKLFCLYYLQYFNATKAYQLAYKCDYRVANVNGSKLLVKASIKKELQHLKKVMHSEVYADAKQLINELLKQANSDIGDYVDFNSYEYQSLDENEQPVINEFTGEPETYKISRVNLKDSSVVDTTLIQEVKKGKDGVSIKLVDKQRALLEVLKRLEVGGDDPTEFDDDGFLAALESEGEELWPEE